MNVVVGTQTRAAEWQVQTDPLSYDGFPWLASFSTGRSSYAVIMKSEQLI